MEAAILAGIGSVLGSLAGGVILGVTECVGSLYLPSAYRDAYGLVFLVVILLFRPAGLFGARSESAAAPGFRCYRCRSSCTATWC